MKKILALIFLIVSLLFLTKIANPNTVNAVVVCEDMMDISFPGCSYNIVPVCGPIPDPPYYQCVDHHDYFCTTLHQTVMCLRESCVAANAYGTSCYCDGSHCGMDKFCNVDTGPVSCEWTTVVQCGDNACDTGENCTNCPQDCGSCTPPPGTCGNGTCGSGETCENCPADCGVCPSNPPPGPCDVPNPPSWCTPKPGVPMIIYNDTNENGVWDSGEYRITPDSCTANYTTSYAGFGITVSDNRGEGWNCNVGTGETNEGCQGDTAYCDEHNCGKTGGDGDGVTNSCLDEKTCYGGGCKPDCPGCPGQRCGGNDTVRGALCGTNIAYCTDGNPYNLRVGPYFKAHAPVGWHATTVTMPVGWAISGTSATNIGTKTNLTCSGQSCTGYVDFQTNGTAGGGWACMGSLIKFGVKRQPLPPPTNLSTLCSANTSQVRFSWNSVTGADGYILRIDHDDQCYNAQNQLIGWACTSTSNCNASYGSGVCADQFIATKGNANCTVVGPQTQCLITIRQGETYLGWSVQPILPGESYPYISPAGNGSQFICQASGNVVGQVWEDLNGTATGGINGCTGPTTTAMGGVSLSLFNGSTGVSYGTQSTSGAGTTTFSNIPYGPPTNPSYVMTLNTATLPAGYTLVCPSSATQTVNTVPNTSNPARFFATLMRDAWYQIRGGSMRAESAANPAEKSVVPGTCTLPSCNPYVLINDTFSQAGYPVTGEGGVISSSENAGTPLAQIRETAKVYGQSSRTSTKEGYDYFYRQFSMGTNPTSDFSDAAKADLQLAQILADGSIPRDGRKAYYANSTVTINQAWSVANGQKVTIFVNGDLNINNTITVAQGGYLAFIVRGNINFGLNVGSSDATSLVPVIQGVYIADGQVRTCSNHTDACGNAIQNVSDLKFVGAGIFVGWQGLSLNRDFSDSALGGLANNRNPAELFFSRPDFLSNAPEEMKKPYYLWQEVNP